MGHSCTVDDRNFFQGGRGRRAACALRWTKASTRVDATDYTDNSEKNSLDIREQPCELLCRSVSAASSLPRGHRGRATAFVWAAGTTRGEVAPGTGQDDASQFA